MPLAREATPIPLSHPAPHLGCHVEIAFPSMSLFSQGLVDPGRGCKHGAFEQKGALHSRESRAHESGHTIGWVVSVADPCQRAPPGAKIDA